MKTVLILALLGLSLCTSVQDQINSLLQTGTKASDAIDAVQELLRDLQQENIDAQLAADKKNETDEFIGQTTISKFTEINHLNQKVYVQSQENRIRFEDELRDTKNYIAWNELRRDELVRLVQQRIETQCYSNQLFIRAIRGGLRAKDYIETLHKEVSGYIATGTAFNQQQTKSIADKLKSNIDLFNNQAIQSFVELAEAPQYAIDIVENPAELSRRTGTLAEQVLQVLEEQYNVIYSHVMLLKDSEIATAWELADWVDLVRAEHEFLEVEAERQQLYADRLATQILAALAAQAKAAKIVKESQSALDQAISDLELKRDAYASAKAKREEDNQVLEQVIQMFREQVRGWSGRN